MKILKLIKEIKIPAQEFNTEKTLLGGQSFLFEKISHENYVGAFSCYVVTIKRYEETFHVKLYSKDLTDFNLERFLMLDINYQEILFKLSKKDNLIKKAISHEKGLRVLRQPMWETIATFVLSSNNTIKNIRNSSFLLKNLFGEEVLCENRKIKLFPSPENILNIPHEKLKEAKIGYRAPYLKNAAILYLKKIKNTNLKNKELIEKLKESKGIGDKIADCIAVFTGNADYFSPVDIWMQRILKNKYNVEFKKYNEYRIWFKNYFGNNAFLAGQFLFEHYRK